jgi:uncharacterized protein YwgA
MGLVIGKKIGHTKELRLSDDFFDYFHIQKKDLEDASKEEIEEVIEEKADIIESESNQLENDRAIDIKIKKESDTTVEVNPDAQSDNRNTDNFSKEENTLKQ